METPLTLTFGVEFEFIARYPLAKYERNIDVGNNVFWPNNGESLYLTKQEKIDRLVRAHIVSVLTKAEFQVDSHSIHVPEDKGFRKWAVISDGSIDASPGNLEERKGHGFTGAELRTPAFLYNAQATGEIRRVLAAVTNKFDVFVNHSCGLHVHVGNGYAGFPLQTLKNFGMLICAFERQFNSMHPMHRIQNNYAKPLGLVTPPGSSWEKVLAIGKLNNLIKIVEYFNTRDDEPDCHTAYNFLNLRYAEQKKTIEFRQHTGTLDTLEATSWVETVTGLVEVCHKRPYPAFTDLIRQHIDDADFSIVDLLHALDMHEQAVYYQGRGIWQHKQQPCDSLFIAGGSNSH